MRDRIADCALENCEKMLRLANDDLDDVRRNDVDNCEGLVKEGCPKRL